MRVDERAHKKDSASVDEDTVSSDGTKGAECFWMIRRWRWRGVSIRDG